MEKIAKAPKSADNVPKRPRGRPPGRPTPHQVNVYMSAKQIAAIDAKRGDKSRSAYIRDAALDKAKWKQAERLHDLVYGTKHAAAD